MSEQVEISRDDETATITGTVSLGFSVEAVWNELIDPVAIEQWWGHPTVFVSGFVPGATGTFEWNGQTFPVLIDDVVPEATWAFRWGELGDQTVSALASSVTFVLTPEPAGTLLTVTENFPTAIIVDEHVTGWRDVLTSFRDYLANEAE